jgi:hypothetical protein
MAKPKGPTKPAIKKNNCFVSNFDTTLHNIYDQEIVMEKSVNELLASFLQIDDKKKKMVREINFIRLIHEKKIDVPKDFKKYINHTAGNIFFDICWSSPIALTIEMNSLIERFSKYRSSLFFFEYLKYSLMCLDCRRDVNQFISFIIGEVRMFTLDNESFEKKKRVQLSTYFSKQFYKMGFNEEAKYLLKNITDFKISLKEILEQKVMDAEDLIEYLETKNSWTGIDGTQIIQYLFDKLILSENPQMWVLQDHGIQKIIQHRSFCKHKIELKDFYNSLIEEIITNPKRLVMDHQIKKQFYEEYLSKMCGSMITYDFKDGVEKTDGFDITALSFPHPEWAKNMRRYNGNVKDKNFKTPNGPRDADSDRILKILENRSKKYN